MSLLKKALFLTVCFLLISGCAQVEEGGEELPEAEEVVVTEAPEQTSKITLASGEWSPYVSENLEHEGVVSRIVREAFALKGVEVEFVYLPWKRSMEEAKIGKWHGTLPWLKNEEREEDFYFTEPIAYENVLFFYKEDSGFDWETISDLEGYKIGGTVGYFYGDEFDNAEKDGRITIERATEDEMNFQKLAAGRVDIVICEIDVGYELIDKVFPPEEAEKIVHHPRSISANPLYLLLSKNVEGNEELIEPFNRGLKRLDESGKLDQYWEESRRGDYKKK